MTALSPPPPQQPPTQPNDEGKHPPCSKLHMDDEFCSKLRRTALSQPQLPSSDPSDEQPPSSPQTGENEGCCSKLRIQILYQPHNLFLLFTIVIYIPLLASCFRKNNLDRFCLFALMGIVCLFSLIMMLYKQTVFANDVVKLFDPIIHER